MRGVRGYSLWLGHAGDVRDVPGPLAADISAVIDLVAGLIREDVPTLVGCGMGLSRSPCIAGAAIARVRGCPADEGLAIALGSSPADVSPGLWGDVRRIVG
jgi:predicted protein tyrosine phosphatase